MMNTIQDLLREYKETRKSLRKAYAQKRSNNIAWFREFWAPGMENEVIHLKIGNGDYGEPRWAGNTLGILGSRKAEELNLGYFDNGRMLSMILSVTNGQLTPQSI
ncbi:hypothetical protein [Brevibacillus daliensis]|uniref:hypothetical protein n=1 Tax=Brevibacillus daliensis TaxID=2892995 RepID=UPI001E2AD387|nr:hypothetical protein [Brevibacillus daliensis]